jgi:transposase
MGEAATPKGFEVLPRRWVVERTFAWLGRNRRMSKDYERLCDTSEALVFGGDDAPYGEPFGPCLRFSDTL